MVHYYTITAPPSLVCGALLTEKALEGCRPLTVQPAQLLVQFYWWRWVDLSASGSCQSLNPGPRPDMTSLAVQLYTSKRAAVDLSRLIGGQAGVRQVSNDCLTIWCMSRG